MRVLLLFFLIQSSSVFAQNYDEGQKTEQNKFVVEKDIEWAIYKNDSLFTDEPDLRKMLIDKAIAKKIKIFYPRLEGSISENNIEFIDTSNYEFVEYGYGGCVLPAFDEQGNIISLPKPRTKLDFTELKGELGLSQILYIKDGILYSHINRISPQINICTAQGICFGKGNHFSTALNSKLNNFNSAEDSIIFIKKTTTQFFIDSINKYNKLKEMFGQNIIETLWPYIKSNALKLFTLKDDKQVTLAQIETENILNLETRKATEYNQKKKKYIFKLISIEITPSLFNKITLTQEWYYNETKNIVFCKIPDAILSIPKLNKEDNDAHEIRIVF